MCYPGTTQRRGRLVVVRLSFRRAMSETKLLIGSDMIASKDMLNPFVHHLELTSTYDKLKVRFEALCLKNQAYRLIVRRQCALALFKTKKNTSFWEFERHYTEKFPVVVDQHVQVTDKSLKSVSCDYVLYYQPKNQIFREQNCNEQRK